MMPARGVFRRLGLSLLAPFLCLSFAAAPTDLSAARVNPVRRGPVGSRIGVNAHIPTVQDLDEMNRAGIGWARVDLTWDVIEPRRGEYRWGMVDQMVARAEGENVRLLGILGYCPAWASSGPSPYFPPRSRAEWKNFVSTIVFRYKGCIDYWCLWNEPNNDGFFAGSLEEFIDEILIPGAKAAKEANPHCRIVGPDLAQLGGSHWDEWLDGILAKAGPYLDVISHHCYKKTPREVFRALEERQYPWDPDPPMAIISRRGQASKPFWLTETGWRTTQMSEERQAGLIISFLKGVLARPWLQRVFLFELKDSPSLPGYGLLRLDCTRKPSYKAVKGFIAANP
jgi:hypothetical protein